MGVSKNRGTPKSSILIGLSIINHPFWGTPIFGNTQIVYMFIRCVDVETVPELLSIEPVVGCDVPVMCSFSQNFHPNMIPRK